jgi:hypothetical protein
MKRKCDYFTGIRKASDEIHFVKTWTYNHQDVESKLYQQLKGSAKKVYIVGPTPYHNMLKIYEN